MFNKKLMAGFCGALFFGVNLSACQTASGYIPDYIPREAGDYQDTVKHIPYAISAPVRDLNIGVKPIPRQLAVLQNPYGTDRSQSCTAIRKEIQDLRVALKLNLERMDGPDFDNKTVAGNVGEAAHEAVRSAAVSVIPYRGAVRYLSGAYRREKDGINADKLGRQRLGFLMGVGAAKRCPGFRPVTTRR